MKVINKPIQVDEEKVIDKVVEDTKRKRQKELLAVVNDKDFKKHIKDLEKDQFFNKGWSKDRNRRWIGRIPLDVYQQACKVFGEKTLKEDRKLFKKVFAPWIFVNKDTI